MRVFGDCSETVSTISCSLKYNRARTVQWPIGISLDCGSYAYEGQKAQSQRDVIVFLENHSEQQRSDSLTDGMCESDERGA